MKKWLSILLIGMICGLGITVSAQENAVPPQKGDGHILEALKIAYITKKLDLSTEEAQRFWPIYNHYMDEIRLARREYQATKNELKLEEDVLNIRKRYTVEFNKAVSPEKVNLFYRSEKEFGNYVQREWQERRQERIQQRRRF
ncbi:MAG: hypothetical protein JST87_15755 [Bacteroidetes bacterium]|nr:hypothetical protein [Bacteroidota bacterium]